MRLVAALLSGMLAVAAFAIGLTFAVAIATGGSLVDLLGALVFGLLFDAFGIMALVGMRRCRRG